MSLASHSKSTIVGYVRWDFGQTFNVRRPSVGVHRRRWRLARPGSGWPGDDPERLLADLLVYGKFLLSCSMVGKCVKYSFLFLIHSWGHLVC